MSMMEKMDKNNDHKLSKEEFSSFATGGNVQ
jgi:EF hand